MGAEVGGAAQAEGGKPVSPLPVREGYRRCAARYDGTPNPLLALETRLLGPRLASMLVSIDAPRRILDAGCGTGRWMHFFTGRSAQVFGLDLSPEMLAFAPLPGRRMAADLARIPLRDNSVDLALCSFALSYATDLSKALAELARVARRILLSDLHPEAMRRGWTRSFRVSEGNQAECRIAYVRHSMGDLDHSAESLSLRREWRIESNFGEPERAIFARAGRERAFAETVGCPALQITLWTK